MAIAALRSVAASTPAIWVMALNTSTAPANEMAKPSAMKTGRALLRWPIEAPSRTGRTGSVHGAATVSIPANSANRIDSIGTGAWVQRRARLVERCRWDGSRCGSDRSR